MLVDLLENGSNSSLNKCLIQTMLYLSHQVQVLLINLTQNHM
jgi:hypothetical protein